MPLAPGSLGLTVLLGVLIALTPLGTDSYVPVLPGLAVSFDASVGSVQLTLTSFFAGLAIGQLIWGPLSDRYGRKPVLLAGISLFFGAALAGAAATSIGEIFWLRLAQGLGMSTGPVSARSIVRDLHSHEQAARLLASATIVFSIVPIAAPLLGAQLLLWWGWQAVFLFLAAVAVALWLAVAYGLRETGRANRSVRSGLDVLRNFRAILADRRFHAPYAAIASAQAGIFAFVSSSAFVLVNGAGVSPTTYSVCFAVVMLGQISGAWASRRFVMQLGIGRMVRYGARLACASGLAAAVLAWLGAIHWAAIVPPFAVYLFATALLIPNATAAALSPFPDRAGAASSLIGSLQFALGAVISSLLGALFDGTPRAMATVTALAGVGAVCAEALLVRPALRASHG